MDNFILPEGPSVKQNTDLNSLVENSNLKESLEILKTIKEGDIIFQTSKSKQSLGIQLATGSNISHVGIILKHKGIFKVFEAVQPVKYTPLEERVNRGEGGDIAIKRYDGNINLEKIKGSVKNYIGKPYDSMFSFGNESIYCSELVYKLFLSSGIELGKKEKIGDLDFSGSETQELLVKRLGLKLSQKQKIQLKLGLLTYKTPNKLLSSSMGSDFKKHLPEKVMKMLSQEIVTPKSLYEDTNLKKVYNNHGFIDQLKH